MFNKEFYATKESIKLHIKNYIERINSEEILLLSTEDLYETMFNEYSYEVVEFSDHYVESSLGKITKTGYNYFENRRVSIEKDGIKLTIHMPFSGSKDLFSFRASTFSMGGVPQFTVYKDEVVFKLEIDEKDDYKRDLNNRIGEIKKHIKWINSDVTTFNKELSSYIGTLINTRKINVLKYKEMLAGLDIPIKKNEELYSEIVEVKKKIIKIVKPKEKEFITEPRLSEQNFKEIINTINVISQQFEKTPDTFKDMGEESIRNIILVILNAAFEGTVTGETFNTKGKTDIMLSYKGKVLFIAECKIFGGKKKHNSTIDQLLSYTSWRDTKSAIIVFNRNKGTTDVVEKVKESTIQHNLYKKTLSQGESSILALYGHSEDRNRELYISTMVYDLPN